MKSSWSSARRTASLLGADTAGFPATVISGVAMLVFSFAPSYAWFLAGCFVWACSSGISGASPAAYAADMAPPGMNAAAMSAYRMLADFGYVAGPLLIGLATDTFGADAALIATAVGLVAVALVFAFLAPETHPRGRPAGPPRPIPVAEPAAAAGRKETRPASRGGGREIAEVLQVEGEDRLAQGKADDREPLGNRDRVQVASPGNSLL